MRAVFLDSFALALFSSIVLLFVCSNCGTDGNTEELRSQTYAPEKQEHGEKPEPQQEINKSNRTKYET